MSACQFPRHATGQAGQSKLLNYKNVGEQKTTSAEDSGSRITRPTNTSSVLAPKQTPCDISETVVTVQHEDGDHGLVTFGQEQHSPASRDVSGLWHEALEQSDDETKEKIKQLNSTEELVQIDQLINLISDKRDAFKADTPSIRVNGKELIWRDCAARFVSILTILGDVASQVAPSPSSAVWAAMKVLLKANVTQCADMVAVLGCIEKVLPLVKRGAVYEHSYLRGRSDYPRRSSMNLREALVEAYKQALKLLVRAERNVEQNSIVRFWYTLQNPEEFTGLMKDFRDAEDRVIKDAHACQVEQGQVNHDDLLKRFGYLHRPLQEIGQNISKAEYERELKFVSQIHVGDQHHDVIRHRLRGTGNWLLQHRDFLQWKQSASSGILWLTGKVGAGKTVLVSHVVDTCIGHDAKRSQAIGDGFAFFYHSKAARVTQVEPSASILQSFVKQLFMSSHCPEMLHIKLMQQIEAAKKAQRTFLTYKECESLLLDFANEAPRTFLILDGLDEFTEWDANEIIIALKKLTRESRGIVKLFISSRNEGHIRKIFNDTEHQNFLLEINISHENRTDIQTFVETETKKNFNAYAVEKQMHLIERLVGGANGMFRWAYLQIEQLKKCKSWSAVLERLKNLPKGLTEAYDELYDKNEGPDRKYLQRAVTWVMFAYERLSTEVLLSAVQLGQSADGTLQIDDRLEEAELENICRHLISKDPDDKWGFPHASVKEYFQDEKNERLRDWVGDAAQVDLAILLVLLFTGYEEWPGGLIHLDLMPQWYNNNNNNNSFSVLQTHYQYMQSSLRRYVGYYWVSHVMTLRHLRLGRLQVLQLLKPFISDGQFPFLSSPRYQKWIQSTLTRNHPRQSWTVGRNYEDVFPAENSIFGIVTLGFFPMLEKLGLEHLDLEQSNALGRSLLAIAARHGHLETCSKLIDLGCEVNRICQVSIPLYFTTTVVNSAALLEAVKFERIDCIELLLKKKADANLDTDTRALCQAVGTRTNIRILELLLQYGAHVDDLCRKCKYRCAFDRATNGTGAMMLLVQAKEVVLRGQLEFLGIF